MKFVLRGAKREFGGHLWGHVSFKVTSRKYTKIMDCLGMYTKLMQVVGDRDRWKR